MINAGFNDSAVISHGRVKMGKGEKELLFDFSSLTNYNNDNKNHIDNNKNHIDNNNTNDNNIGDNYHID